MPRHDSSAPHVAVRTVANGYVGFGHLRRCLTLARDLRSQGANVVFWIDGEEEAVSLATSAGFTAVGGTGPEPGTTLDLIRRHPVRILIADSYRHEPAVFTAWRPQLDCLVCIDDLADRLLDVDIIVNSSPTASTLRYRTGRGCRLLLGSQYALIRSEFSRASAPEVKAHVGRVLLTLGGADPKGWTTGALGVVLDALPRAEVDVVAGPLFGAAPALDDLGQRSGRVAIHRGLQDLAPLMQTADLAVSGGGQTLFELAASGVPAVALCLAPNQQENIAALAAVPTLLPGGLLFETADWSTLAAAVRRLDTDTALRRTMSQAGVSLIDCRGPARVAASILDFTRPPA